VSRFGPGSNGRESTSYSIDCLTFTSGRFTFMSMKPTYSPEELLGSRSRIAVLRVLWSAASPLNTSQIAARAKLTRPAVASVLDSFDAAGLVRSSPAGPANVHLLERESVYVSQYVAPLFEAELALPQLLEEDIRDAFERIAQSGVLFGSYARGEQDAHSDVDIVLVADDADSKRALDEKALDYGPTFRRRWGASLSAVTYEAREANALWRTAPAFAESLRSGGLVIFGKGPWEWVEDG